jgi:hypothetical protein
VSGVRPLVAAVAVAGVVVVVVVAVVADSVVTEADDPRARRVGVAVAAAVAGASESTHRPELI